MKITAGNSASAKVDVTRSTEQTIVMQAFKQIYYTVTIEEPGAAGSVFASDVLLSPQNMNNTKPPGLVRSVDYGRIIIVQMTIQGAVTEIDAEAAMDYATGGLNIQGHLKTKYEGITKNSQFKVLALGGSADSANELFSGDPGKIVGVIKTGIKFSKANPGFPISYKVADLRTRELAKMSVTTDYIETNCQEYPNGWVELRHAGGFVAYFTVNWKQKNDQGNLVEAPGFSSGDKTAGYAHKIWLPGDATDIRIKGVNYTGLVWDKTRVPLNLRPNAVPNKCYKIWGTTLDPKSGEC